MAAPSYKSILIALLVVFATVVAPNLQQVAAIRADGAETKAPSPRGTPIHLMDEDDGGMFSNFPCFPFLPKIVRDLCDTLFKPAVPECRSSLEGKLVSSCTGFLTNSTVHKPSKSCCKHINELLSDPASRPCFCHIANGDIGQLLPAPLIKQKRAITVLSKCDTGLSEHQIKFWCIDQAKNTPIPPMDEAAPPPEDDDSDDKA